MRLVEERMNGGAVREERSPLKDEMDYTQGRERRSIKRTSIESPIDTVPEPLPWSVG